MTTDIELPTEPTRKRRRGADPASDATVDAVQQTLAEYERLAISTGEWNGTDAPEFSDDGLTWDTAWLPMENDDHPLLARATVYRKHVERPIVVVIRWDEAFPAIDEWRELWMRKPVALFGAFALRAALRRAFRDAIGDTRAPDEQHHDETPGDKRMTAAKLVRGTRALFTIRHPAFDGAEKHTGETVTLTQETDCQGTVIRFDDGTESYAFNDEIEATE